MKTAQQSATHHGAGEILLRMSEETPPHLRLDLPAGETAWLPGGSWDVIVGPTQIEYAQSGSVVTALPLSDAATAPWGEIQRPSRRRRR